MSVKLKTVDSFPDKKKLHQERFQKRFAVKSFLANITSCGVQTSNVSSRTVLKAFSWELHESPLLLNIPPISKNFYPEKCHDIHYTLLFTRSTLCFLCNIVLCSLLDPICTFCVNIVICSLLDQLCTFCVNIVLCSLLDQLCAFFVTLYFVLYWINFVLSF